MKILLTGKQDDVRQRQLTGEIALPGLEDRAETVETTVNLDVQEAGDRWYIKAQVDGRIPCFCDRCRGSFTDQLDGEFTLVVLRTGAVGLDPEDGDEVVLMPEGSSELDLTGKVRETLILALPIRFLCSEDCAGLCPGCGADLNRDSCSCERETDPRWAALNELKQKMTGEAPSDQESSCDEE